MNIFVLGEDITLSAQYHTDKHIVKMPTELAQMVSHAYQGSSLQFQPEFIMRSKSHINHPCSKWIRATKTNFKWACEFGLALYNEYQYRYNKPDKHQRCRQIFEYGLMNIPSLLPYELIITDQPLCMPDYCKFYIPGTSLTDVVKSYRYYYLHEKSELFKWTGRKAPTWLPKELQKLIP